MDLIFSDKKKTKQKTKPQMRWSATKTSGRYNTDECLLKIDIWPWSIKSNFDVIYMRIAGKTIANKIER